MATVNLGQAAIVSKGAYSAAASYAPLNLVTHNGGSYLCKAACSNIEPGVASSWQTYWAATTVGIKSFAQTGETAAGIEYTITLSDGSSYVFTVKTAIEYPISISNGGTGATTASAALAALGALSSSAGSVGTSNLGSKVVTAAKIADKTITAAQIADLVITAAKIVDKTITAAKIADATITATQIANATITGAKMVNGTVTNTQLSATAVKLTFTNTSVAASAFVSNSTYSDFPYRAAVALTGVTAAMVPEVFFGLTDAMSGNFAPVAASYAGGIYIYAAAKPSAATTIPTIFCWR